MRQKVGKGIFGSLTLGPHNEFQFGGARVLDSVLCAGVTEASSCPGDSGGELCREDSCN